jgi:hypothetical protein
MEGQLHEYAPDGSIAIHDPHCPWKTMIGDGVTPEPFPEKFAFLCCCEPIAIARFSERYGLGEDE